MAGLGVHAVGEGEDYEAAGDEHLEEEEEHGCGDGVRTGRGQGGEDDEKTCGAEGYEEISGE